MTKLFEDWLVELAKNENYSLLDRLPGYLASQYEKADDALTERNRLASYFSNHAPRTPFANLVLEEILGSLPG